ncbi:MAG: FAD-dependent oxidoreductase [Chloroflexi bacterium]|nr:FAD-dependent oxidoreductase [Chloroflexota bacterium]
MKYDFDLTVIGGGSAGLLAARVAPNLGVKTALIERGRLGGDCLWTGCVPSKALLASAKAAHTLHTADRFGLPGSDAPIDTAKVWQRIHDIQEDIAAHEDSPEAVAAGGTEVIFGEALVEDGHRVRVGDRVIFTRYILICTGSWPTAPPIDGLQEIGFLTSETIFQLERAPASLLIVGGGPIGVEMAQAMNRLGVKVTLLEAFDRILTRDEPSLSEQLLAVLRNEGVDAQVGVRLERAERHNGKTLYGEAGGGKETWSADEIFVAAGRAPNIESLGLAKAGVETGPKGVIVDKHLRSSVSSIYAVGDCAGRFLFTHSAGAETGAALRNMFYPGGQDAPTIVPWTTFTDPELAHVGVTSEEARKAHGQDGICLHEADLAKSDRARADSASSGKIVVVTKKGSHEILGAHILGPSAGEMIGQFSLAIQQQIPLVPAFRDLIQVYPTYATSITQLTEEAVYEQLERPFYRAARKLGDLLGE